MEIDDKKLSELARLEVENKIKELDYRDELARSLKLDIQPLGDCPLINKLPISAIKHCMEKNKPKCHCIKRQLKKCKGGY